MGQDRYGNTIKIGSIVNQVGDSDSLTVIDLQYNEEMAVCIYSHGKITIKTSDLIVK